jgi:hypothetical protein
VYAFYRRLDVSADVEPNNFVSQVEEEVSRPAAPIREARVGGLHRVSLRSESRLSESKLEQLKSLSRDPNFRKSLSEIILNACLLQPPLYVGKAVNLQTRLRQHLEFASPLQDRLSEVGIDIKKSILVYNIVPQFPAIDGDQEEGETALLIEDIVTRICRPGFVMRIG